MNKYVLKLEKKVFEAEVNFSEALECVDDIYFNAVFVKKEGQTVFDSHHKLFGESPETHKTISEQCSTIKQALLTVQNQNKVIVALKKHFILEDKGIEKYNNKTKYLIKIESKDTGASIHIHLDDEEEKNYILNVFNQNIGGNK